jgi:NAD(P)-dependent dehydrogenase (short-subunit alcohol dehydrogenase family)
MSEPEKEKTIVVTGGSRGLGRGLCEAFLDRGCNVVFCGRNVAQVHTAATEMGLEASGGRRAHRVLGVVADVARYADLERVWDCTIERYKHVDVWINNAGASNVQRAFYELPKSDIEAIVGGNLIGTMNGVHIALTRMRAQGHGHVFTMEGYGSDGSIQHGMSIYGATKTAIRYFTRSVVSETRGGAVKVGSLSPGIVITDLLLDVYRRGSPENWKRQRWLFELIADPVEDVAPWLVERVLAGPKHGEHVAWMTVARAIMRAFQPKYYRRKLFAGRLTD